MGDCNRGSRKAGRGTYPGLSPSKQRDMLPELTLMCDGFLGAIGIKQHRIHFLPNTPPVAKHPYCAAPKAREEENSQVEKIFRAGLIEPTQSPWAS